MTFHRFLTFVIYAAVVAGAVGRIVYLWPELTAAERWWMCVGYGVVIAALGLVVFL